MPAMYPEELRRLREQNPGLQYDFRGNVIGTAPADPARQVADAVYQRYGDQPDAWSFGPTRADYQNSEDFVGPMPQQWWDPNGELMQQGQDWLGSFMQGRDLRPRGYSRPRNPYAGQPASDFSSQMVPPEVRGMASEAGPANPTSMLPPELRYQPTTMHEQHMRANALLGGNPYGLSRSPLGRAMDWAADTGRRAAEAQDWAEGIY